jgi:hypothetical protein
MSNLNTILNKLGKIEEIEQTNLAKHEVELASKYDFKPFKEEYDKAFVDYRENYRKGITLAKSATDTYSKDLTNLLNKSESLINEFGTKAEELGIDFRNTPTYKEFQDLKKIILSSTSSVKEKQKAISAII